MLPPQYRLAREKQRGTALMLMLVIMVIGIAAVLVGSLSASALKSARQEITAAALAQAKEALVGRAVQDINHPGSLPCPDTDDDGSAELMSGNDCPSYTGRLPWRTLKLPDLRDGDGERLWYVLSANFRDGNSALTINSDTQGQLSIAGNVSLGNIAAIVFAPGAPLAAQVRGTADANTLSNYLEGDNANGDNVHAAHMASDIFNDSLLGIGADQIFQIVEKRIAREAKACLDNYAAASGGKYPWAAPVTDTAAYSGALDT
ncbi:MAG: hypothetical protein EPN14_02990, partial [Gallionella sp.]